MARTSSWRWRINLGSRTGNTTSTLRSRLRHQVGAAEVDLFLAGVPEIVDPAMLKETPYDAGHPDVFAYAFHSRSQAAYPAHQQINLYTSLRCFVQQADGALVDECVHLKDQVSTLAVAQMIDLALDHLFQVFPQIDGGNQQLSVFGLGRVAGEVVEQVGAVGTDRFVRGEHSD